MTEFQSEKPKKKKVAIFFWKILYGKIVKMLYAKYQCHQGGKIVLNRVPKFAQCEMKIKLSKSRQVFKVKN